MKKHEVQLRWGASLAMAGLLVSACMLLTGCSSFPRDYEATVARRRGTTLEGAWEGEWVSHGGHRGRLRCIVSNHPPTGDNPRGGGVEVVARFEAKFFAIFTGHYDVTMTCDVDRDGKATLKGDHDLGSLAGGNYHYEAVIFGDRFEATYRSRADEGDFHMARRGVSPNQ